MTDNVDNNPPNHHEANPDDTYARRVWRLATMQVQSIDPEFSIAVAPKLTQQMLLETPAPPESDKWRAIITSATNPLLTDLWALYQSDCRARGELEKPYEIFIQLAATLRNPELPRYWEFYLADCKTNDRYPDKTFFEFMRDMQRVLDIENNGPGFGGRS